MSAHVHKQNVASRYINCNSKLLIDKTIARRYNSLMRKEYEIRKENLFSLRRENEADNAFAERLGIAPSYLGQIKKWPYGKNSRPVGDRLAPEIEEKLDLPKGWLSEDHSNGTKSNPRSSAKSDPLYGFVEGRMIEWEPLLTHSWLMERKALSCWAAT